MRRVLIVSLAIVFGPVVSTVRASPPLEWMLELTVRGHRIEGAPVAWNAREVVLMGRDGRIWQFAPQEAADYRKTSEWFRGYSPSELRSQLLRELGNGFEVTGTGHYVVAHPRGTRDQWADRFEGLYRRFLHYFSVRGFALSEPPFLLTAIVCRNRQEFARYATASGVPVGAGLLGYYCNRSNRIVLYDVGAGGEASTGWERNAATVIHEATHQMAFNTGVHDRFALPPVWVAEGMATVFEGVVGSGASSDAPRTSRLNRLRIRDFFDEVTPNHRPELLADLVTSDRLFQAAPTTAYAEAWALTFYLTETQPARYAQYLARINSHPPLAQCSAAERTADFTAVFGSDWRMLEARLLRFIEELKPK